MHHPVTRAAPPALACRRQFPVIAVLPALLIAAGLSSSAAVAQTAVEPTFSIRTFVVDGENPLDDSETNAILAPFTGEQRGVTRLQQAARQLEAGLRERGYGFYRVTLPPQDVTDTVTLKLVMFRVGRVTVEENQHYSEDNIRASFPTLREGQSPNAREIARNLAMFNDHPGKQAVVTLAESETRDAIDVQLRVRDEKPVNGFAVLQNTGSDSTGEWRLSVGVQHANLFDRDQQLIASYTTSPDKYHSKVHQYGLNWVIPFYGLSSTLSAYAVYSDVDSGRVGGFFDVSGRGTFGGARWTYRLLPQADVNQTLAAAIDYKDYQNDVLFSGQNQGTDVSALPLTLAYGGEWRQGWGKVEWGADYAFNLPSGKNGSSENYAGNRAEATRQWDAWRSFASFAWQAPTGWAVHGRWRGQYSGKALIPGEQFGLGGANSVRGYDEREVSGDKGYSTSVELWSKPYAEQLRFLVFRDIGQVRYNDSALNRHSLASFGAGVRWQPHRNVGISLDVAQAQRNGPEHDVGDWHGHAMLTVRF